MDNDKAITALCNLCEVQAHIIKEQQKTIGELSAVAASDARMAAKASIAALQDTLSAL